MNTNRTVRTLVDNPAGPSAAEVPPEVELQSPTWYEQIDPSRPSIEVRGQVFARSGSYSCQVFVAPGHYPNNAPATGSPPGDFRAVPAAGGACDGAPRTAAADGKLAEIATSDLESYFPPGTDFDGALPPTTLATNNGRPHPDPHGFVVKVVAITTQSGVTLTGEDRRAAFLHSDQDMLDGFPKAIAGGGRIGGPSAIPTADGESSPAFADLDGDNRNDLVFADDNGFVHALRPDGTELPGWPVRGDVPGFVSSHTATDAYQTGAVSDDLGGAIVGSVAVGDANRDGIPEVYAADLEGKLYGWSAAGERIFTEESNIDFSGKPLAPFENVRYQPGQAEFRRTQHGFIGSPVLADLDGDDGGRLEIVAAAMDRHVYAWEANDPIPGSPGGANQLSGYPMLVVDPIKVDSIDPQTHAVTFRSDANSSQQGAIIVTPALADLDADADTSGPDERPEIVIGTNEEYEEPMNAGNFTTATFFPLSGSGLLGPGNSRLYALSPDGDRDGNPNPANAILPGWPFKVGIANRELLPVVGEGISGYPVVAPVTCPSGGGGPKIGVLANNGPAYVLNANGTSCYGNDPTTERANALESDFAPSAQQYDHPVLPAVGHPAFGDIGGPGLAFLSPAAGLGRALDVAAPEYQNGQDFIGVWDASTSQFHAGFPAAVNDLQFLTGPSIADVDGLPGEELVEGTSSKDLAAFNSVGAPPGGWPKLSSDWTVANPLIGSFGTLDTDAGATKVVIGMTRSGYVNGYRTDAPACSPSSWPRFHHDNANSGDYLRDAMVPGRPTDERLSSGSITLTAPGDELMCGPVDRFELVTSDQPIDASNWSSADPLPDQDADAAPGSTETLTVPAEARRYVGIRAADEQGNV
ncbi:MAG: FG-GAP repeat domain-containing protein, partial [Actinomycetota bacterium]